MGNENGFENVCSYTPIEMKCTLCCGIYCDYKDTLNEIISSPFIINMYIKCFVCELSCVNKTNCILLMAKTTILLLCTVYARLIHFSMQWFQCSLYKNYITSTKMFLSFCHHKIYFAS